MTSATTCKDAARAGDLAALKALRDAGAPWDASTTLNAAVHQHPAVVTYALENGCPWTLPCDAEILDDARRAFDAGVSDPLCGEVLAHVFRK